MFYQLQTRGNPRALIFAALSGAGMGIAVGLAYLAGGMAQAQVQQSRVSHLSSAARQGFSDIALQHLISDMGPGAAALAARHLPDDNVGAAHAASAALTAARSHAAAPAPIKVALVNPLLLQASAPFRLGGALESSREFDCMTAAVYYEARGETPAGQAAVAQVVLNRMRHPAFPKTVCGVVFQGAGNGGCQFSFACNGAMHRGREPAAWDRAKAVAGRALSGFVMSDVGRATHFHVAALGKVWGGGMVRVAQVGGHVFYTFSGRAGLRTGPSDEPSLADVTVAANTPPADGGDPGVTTTASAAPAPGVTSAAVAAVRTPEAPAKDHAAAVSTTPMAVSPPSASSAAS